MSLFSGYCSVMEGVWTDNPTVQRERVKLPGLQRAKKKRDDASALLEGFLEEVAF